MNPAPNPSATAAAPPPPKIGSSASHAELRSASPSKKSHEHAEPEASHSDTAQTSPTGPCDSREAPHSAQPKSHEREWQGAPRPAAKAALFMLGSSLGFVAMVVFIRLASSSTPSTEIAFFRNFFGLLTLLPIVLRPSRPFPRTRHIRRYMLRTSIGLTSMLCSFWVIAHLPLSQAISLSYSAPIFVTLGAVFLLRETVRIRRWAAVAAGFAGVLVILQPWGHAFSPAMLVAVLAAVLTATVSIQNKQLSQLDPPETVVLYTYLFWVPMSLIPALWQWQWPDTLGWLWLVGTGIFGTLGQLLWVRALRIGEVSALQPITFIQLPIVVLFGWWLFDETPDRWTPIGAAIILAANTYIVRREAYLASAKPA